MFWFSRTRDEGQFPQFFLKPTPSKNRGYPLLWQKYIAECFWLILQQDTQSGGNMLGGLLSALFRRIPGTGNNLSSLKFVMLGSTTSAEFS